MWIIYRLKFLWSVFLPFFLFALIPGVFLWEIKRWKKSTAIIFISSRGLLLFIDVSLYLFFHSSYSNQVPKLNTAIFNAQTLINSIIIGLIVLAVGVFLFVYGKKKNLEMKPMIDVSPSWEIQSYSFKIEFMALLCVCLLRCSCWNVIRVLMFVIKFS